MHSTNNSFSQTRQEALQRTFSVKIFSVCKQDGFETSVIPQLLTLPKKIHNLAVIKNILTDAKDLDAPLISERCATPPGMQCSFSEQ